MTSFQKFIFVGDLHVKSDNLEESFNFIQWLSSFQKDLKLPIIFSGDQYNDHGIIKLEIFKFWEKAYKLLAGSGYPSISLVGNHDMNQAGTETIMTAHGKYTTVIDSPTVYGSMLLLPFFRKNEDFIKAVQKNKSDIILCHQEFNGCAYENGFFSSVGIDPCEVSDRSIVISGHIHKQQKFGNIWYPGAPRPLTRSDVNTNKGIWIVDLENLTNSEFIPTPLEVCKSYVHLEISDNYNWDDCPYNEKTHKIYVDLKGDQDFIKKNLKQVPRSAKVRTFIINTNETVQVKESDGISKAFLDYSQNYFEKEKLSIETSKEILNKICGKVPMLKD